MIKFSQEWTLVQVTASKEDEELFRQMMEEQEAKEESAELAGDAAEVPAESEPESSPEPIPGLSDTGTIAWKQGDADTYFAAKIGPNGSIARFAWVKPDLTKGAGTFGMPGEEVALPLRTAVVLHYAQRSFVEIPESTWDTFWTDLAAAAENFMHRYNAAEEVRPAELIWASPGPGDDTVYIANRSRFMETRSLEEIRCEDIEAYGAFTRIAPGVYSYQSENVPLVTVMAGLGIPLDLNLSAWASYMEDYGSVPAADRMFAPEDLVFVFRDWDPTSPAIYIAPLDYVKGFNRPYREILRCRELSDAGFIQMGNIFLYRGEIPRGISGAAHANRVLQEIGLNYSPRLDDLIQADAT